MWLKGFDMFLFYCVVTVCAKIEEDFVFDYFVYKQVPNVVGFTCDTTTNDDFSLLKRLNRIGMRVMLYKLCNAYISRVIQTHYHKLGIFIDLRCCDKIVVRIALAEAANARFYDELRCWILLAHNLEDTVQVIDDRSFGLSTDLVVVPMNSLVQDLVLYDVYNPWKQGHGHLNVTKLATWNPQRGLKFYMPENKVTRRFNLQGMTLRTAFFGSKYKPANVSLQHYLENSEKNTVDGFTKFGYIVLGYVAEMFNISLSISEIAKWEKNDTVGPMSRALNNNEIDISGNPVVMNVPRLRMAKFVYPSWPFSLQFGEIKKWLPGDTLGPMSRALVQNEMQITGSPVIISEERLRLTKFVYPAWPFRTCFVFRNPQSQVIKVGEVLHPFADETWNVTLIAGFTIFVILAFSLKQETNTTLENIWSKSLLITVGSLCQQGTNFNFDKISTRIVFINLMILSYLIYNYYNAAVMSTKLNEPIFKINDSVNELGKLGFKMASESMNYFEFIFTRLSEWERKVFYEARWLKIPEAERFMKPEEAIPLVQKGGFAYHSHPDVIYPIIDRTFSTREICELMEVHPLVPRYSTLSVSYNSTFVELAKIGLSRMTEVGIRHRLIRRWTSRKPVCNRDEMNIESVDIYEFAPHLMLLAIGMTMATVVFTCELVSVNYWRNQEW